MGMFFRLFDPRKQYDEKVEALVQSANILAISSFNKFFNAHNELATVDQNDWDFFVTVAGVSVGLIGLANRVRNEAEYKRLTKKLSSKITEWDNRGELAMGDLMSRMVKYHEEMINLPEDQFTKMWASLISSWCFVNLELEIPRNQPNNLMIELGMLLIISFRDWWSDNKTA